MPARVFHAPRRFHPGYSPLGRWLRRRTGDHRYAEALHVLLLTGLALALLFLHFLSGALLGELWAAQPSARWIYGLSLAGLGGAGLVPCVVGLRPALTVTCAADTLRLAQGASTITVPYAALASVQRITAQRFHRHERRYAATRTFLGVLDEDVLLLRTADAPPVVIALPAADLDALQTHLETARTPARTENDFATERTGAREHGSTGETK